MIIQITRSSSLAPVASTSSSVGACAVSDPGTPLPRFNRFNVVTSGPVVGSGAEVSTTSSGSSSSSGSGVGSSSSGVGVGSTVGSGVGVGVGVGWGRVVVVVVEVDVEVEVVVVGHIGGGRVQGCV